MGVACLPPLLTVGNGEEAIAALRDGAADVVIMDSMMPGMNGIDCARIIRSGEIGGTAADVPIVMLTAVTGEEAERMARAAGANAFLHKTSSIKLLCAEIRKLL